MMICARLDRIKATLDQLAKAVEQLLVRHIADDYAALASALGRLGMFPKSSRDAGVLRMR